MKAKKKRDKLEVIRSFPFFGDISNDTLETLAKYFVSKDLEEGERLWRENSQASNFSFIVEGRIKVVKNRRDNKQIICGIFGAGAPIGHIAVFEEMDYPASAVAVSEALVLQIHRSHFLGILRDEPKLMEAVLKNIMGRNFSLIRRLHNVTVSGAEQRLALFFHTLSFSDGIRKKLDNGDMGIHIPVSLSRSDLAQMINTRVETAIRLMSRWREQDLVETESEGFVIKNPEALRQKAQTVGENLSFPCL